jgi:hypothetical protein
VYGNRMRLLLHICCAPCSIYPIEHLKEKGLDIQGYFFNPNIHPFTEWLKRKETLEKYARQAGLKLIVDEGYQLEEFLREVIYREAIRCRFCYLLRLRRTAQVALKGGFDAFTTTLLVSPFQKPDLIRDTGKATGEEYNIPFYYVDFRPGFKEATLRSKELGMYRQQYCGCIYSEKERYHPGQKKK